VDLPALVVHVKRWLVVGPWADARVCGREAHVSGPNLGTENYLPATGHLRLGEGWRYNDLALTGHNDAGDGRVVDHVG